MYSVGDAQERGVVFARIIIVAYEKETGRSLAFSALTGFSLLFINIRREKHLNDANSAARCQFTLFEMSKSKQTAPAFC